MSSPEDFFEIPNEEPYSVGHLGGNAIQSQDEYLRLGMTQLGEALSTVAQGGPEQVGRYLHDVLANSEGLVDQRERFAALHVLASAERHHLVAELGRSKTDAVTRLRQQDGYLDESTGKKLQTAFQQMEPVKQALITLRRGSATETLLRRVRIDGEAAARRFTSTARAMGEGYERWGHEQTKLIHQLRDVTEQVGSHDRALQAGLQSLDHVHEQTPQDLSPLISTVVLQDFSARFTQTLEGDAGNEMTPGEVFEDVMHLYAGTPLEYELRRSEAFAAEYAAVLRKSKIIVVRAEDARQKAGRLASGSADGLGRGEGLEEFAHTQLRHLEGMQSDTQAIYGNRQAIRTETDSLLTDKEVIVKQA